MTRGSKEKQKKEIDFHAMKYHATLTTLTVLAAITMLITFIGYNGFWIDELYTLHSIRLGWKEMALERLHRGHFPGYFVVARLWFAVWPDHLFETALRFLSVLFYLFALAAFWPLARKILSPPASLVAVALFACNEIALRQAVEARMYTLTLLIGVGILRAWYELQNPAALRRWAFAMPLLAVAGFMVSATVGVLLSSMLVVTFFNRAQNRRAFIVTAVSLAMGLAVFIPGAILHLQTGRRVGIASSKPTVFLTHIVALMPGVQVWDDYYKTDARLVGLLVVGGAITLSAIWMLWKKRKELPTPLRRMAIMVALPVGLITLSYPLVELFSLAIMGPPRYFITLMPMAALVGAWALMQFPRRLAVHCALTVFLMFSAWTILTVRTEKFRERVTGYVASQYQPEDGLVVTAREIADGVEYYLPGAKVDEAVSRWITDRNALRARLRPLSDRKTVWLIWYRGNDSPLIEVAKEMWGPLESNRPDEPYGKLRIYKFKPRG